MIIAMICDVNININVYPFIGMLTYGLNDEKHLKREHLKKKRLKQHNSHNITVLEIYL